MPALKFGVLALVCLAAGCASSSGRARSLAVAANNSATVDRDLDGTVVLRSQQTHSVAVRPLNETFTGDMRSLPSFSVIVTNGGEQNLTLKPGDVSAFSGDRVVGTLDPATLQDRLDRAQGIGTRGARDNFPIGRDATQSGEPIYQRNQDGSPTMMTRTDPSDPAMGRFEAPKFKVPARMVEDALQPQMIRPGDVGGGRILLDPQDMLPGLPLKVVVMVAGEKHAFLFDVRE